MSEPESELSHSLGLPPEMLAYLTMGSSPVVGLKRKLHEDEEGDEFGTGTSDGERLSETSRNGADSGSGSLQRQHSRMAKKIRLDDGMRSTGEVSSEGIADNDDIGWASADDYSYIARNTMENADDPPSPVPGPPPSQWASAFVDPPQRSLAPSTSAQTASSNSGVALQVAPTTPVVQPNQTANYVSVYPTVPPTSKSKPLIIIPAANGTAYIKQESGAPPSTPTPSSATPANGARKTRTPKKQRQSDDEAAEAWEDVDDAAASDGEWRPKQLPPGAKVKSSTPQKRSTTSTRSVSVSSAQLEGDGRSSHVPSPQVQAGIAAREKAFRDDPCVKELEPTRVLCAMCGSWLKLSTARIYDPHHWDVHKSRCKARPAWIQAGGAYIPPVGMITTPPHHATSTPYPSALPLSTTPVASAPQIMTKSMSPGPVSQPPTPSIAPSEDIKPSILRKPPPLGPPRAPPSSQPLPPLFSSAPLILDAEVTAADVKTPTTPLSASGPAPDEPDFPPADFVTAGDSADGTPSKIPTRYDFQFQRMTEEDRRRIIEHDPDVRESRPDAVLCNMCNKWIKLSNTQPYAFGNWSGQKGHKIRCRERNPDKTRDHNFQPGPSLTAARQMRQQHQLQHVDDGDGSFVPNKKKLGGKSAMKPQQPGVRSSSRVATLAAQQEAALRDDPRVRLIQDGRAQCNGCGKWVKIPNFGEHCKFRCHKAWSKNGRRGDDDEEEEEEESEEEEEDVRWRPTTTKPVSAAAVPPTATAAVATTSTAAAAATTAQDELNWWRRRSPTPPPPRPISPQPDYVVRYAHYLAPNAAFMCAPGNFTYSMIRPSPWLPGVFAGQPPPAPPSKFLKRPCPHDPHDNGDNRSFEELATSGLLVPPPAPTMRMPPPPMVSR